MKLGFQAVTGVDPVDAADDDDDDGDPVDAADDDADDDALRIGANSGINSSNSINANRSLLPNMSSLRLRQAPRAALIKKPRPIVLIKSTFSSSGTPLSQATMQARSADNVGANQR